jgi:hypothetical protein
MGRKKISIFLTPIFSFWKETKEKRRGKRQDKYFDYAHHSDWLYQ